MSYRSYARSPRSLYLQHYRNDKARNNLIEDVTAHG